MERYRPPGVSLGLREKSSDEKKEGAGTYQVKSICGWAGKRVLQASQPPLAQCSVSWTNSCRPDIAPASVLPRSATPPLPGYYPKLFYPKIGKIAESFIPDFTTAYYIKASRCS